MRSEILELNEITEWKILSSEYKIGLKYMGEFRMGSEWAKIVVSNSSGEEILNFGELRFTNRFEGHVFYITDLSGRFLLLDWMFFKLSVHLTPVVFDLQEHTFCFLDTAALLNTHTIELSNNHLVIVCTETYWQNTKSRQRLKEYRIDLDKMKDIEQFYTLDEESLRVAILKWIDFDSAEVSYA